MGVVAYLKYLGFEAQEVEYEEGNCRWTFFATPSLLSAVDDFVCGTGMVEPRAYNAQFASVKRELHGVMGQR